MAIVIVIVIVIVRALQQTLHDLWKSRMSLVNGTTAPCAQNGVMGIRTKRKSKSTVHKVCTLQRDVQERGLQLEERKHEGV